MVLETPIADSVNAEAHCAIYAWKKETVERSFAEAKVNHGLRFARMLGLRNMQEQSFLTAAVQNIKRLIAFLLSYIILLTSKADIFFRKCRPLSEV